MFNTVIQTTSEVYWWDCTLRMW